MKEYGSKRYEKVMKWKGKKGMEGKGMHILSYPFNIQAKVDMKRWLKLERPGRWKDIERSERKCYIFLSLRSITAGMQYIFIKIW